MSITEAFELYRAEYIVFKNQSYKTEENHLICMRSLVAFFGDIDISQLTYDAIRRWKLELAKHRSERTVRNYIIKLRVVLKHVLSRGVSCIDPARVPVPKAADRPPEYLSREDVARCIDATQRIKNKAIVSMLYGSMLRVSELCSLDRKQIHGNRFTVVGKGGKSRICFIDERTNKLLNEYILTRVDDSPALFLADNGRRIKPGTIQETFKTIRKQTGLNCHPHTMRHSGATNLMQNGIHIYSLQRLLGHSNLQSTEVYLHVTDPQLEQQFMRCRTV